MEGAFVLLPILLIVAAGIGIWWLRKQLWLRKIAAAQALAARHGFAIDTSRKKPPPHPFDAFRVGSDKEVTFHMWRPGSEHSVFQYEYTTGSGDSRSTHRRTCALVALPFVAPHTRIGREGLLSRIARSVGMRDIEVESPEFNRTYRVRSDDERFAITLLDPPMIAWMLEPASGRGSVELELSGRYLLCVVDQLSLEQMFGFHDWAQQFLSKMPAVLPSLYPPAGFNS